MHLSAVPGLLSILLYFGTPTISDAQAGRVASVTT